MIEGLGTRLHNFNIRVPERGSLGTRLWSGHEKQGELEHMGGGALNNQELPGYGAILITTMCSWPFLLAVLLCALHCRLGESQHSLQRYILSMVAASLLSNWE